MATYNLAKTAVEAALLRVKESTAVRMDMVSATNGVFTRSATTSMAADQYGVLAVVNGHFSAGTPRLLSKAEARTIALKIDALAVGSDHLNVKNNTDWQRIYQRSARNYPVMDAHGNVGQQNIDTVPCHNCGIIVPVSMAQIDHHMPQAVGGESLYTLKMARSLGLTEQGAVRGKGAAIGAGNLATLVLHPRGRDSTYNHLYNVSAAKKWTTNDKGNAFFSLLAHCPGALVSVQERCKNSVLNLVPLCSECNRNKSDWVKHIA